MNIALKNEDTFIRFPKMHHPFVKVSSCGYFFKSFSHREFEDKV